MNQTRHLILRLCLAAGSLSLTLTALGDAMSDKFEAEGGRVFSSAASLQTAWVDAIRGLPKGIVGALEITYDDVVGNNAIRLFGVHDQSGTWLTLEAWVPTDGTRCKVAQQEKLVCDGKGGVTGSVEVELPASMFLVEGKARWATFTLKKSAEKMLWAGSMTADPKNATVKWSDVSGTLALPADYVIAPKKHASVFAAYADAVALEELACLQYRTILAASRLGQEKGWRVPDYPVPRRPAFVSRAAKAAAAAPTLDTMAGPGLGDIDMGLGLDDMGTAVPAPAAGGASEPLSKHPDAADRLKQLESIHAHLDALVTAVRRSASADQAEPVTAAWPDLPDRLFGACVRMHSLAREKEGGNSLPAHDPSGAISWGYVDNWQVIGPWQDDTPATDSPVLPTRFCIDNLTYPPDVDTIPKIPMSQDPILDPEKVWLAWQYWPVDHWTGLLRPPNWWEGKKAGYSKTTCGMPETSWFGATVIHCQQDGEYWVAAGIDLDGQLWINDALVAAWPDLRRHTDTESPILFRYAFRKGENHVVVRVRQEREFTKVHGTSGFWIRICTAGGPLSAAAAAERDARMADVGNLKALPEHFDGWRHNRAGLVPNGPTPPTAWSYAKKQNVLWEVPLTLSLAAPLVVGDVVITMADPYFLIALDKMTGEIKWRRSLSVIELLDKPLADEAQAYWDSYFRFLPEFTKANPEALDTETISVEGKSVIALDAFQDMRKRQGALEKKEDAVLKKAGHVGGYLWEKYMGPAPSTPVTDGKHIWAWTCHGGAACFDAEGNRKWLVELPSQGTAYGAYSSPMLLDSDKDGAGDMVLIEVVPEDIKYSLENRPVVLLALDAATGEELWRAPVQDPSSAASPTAMRLSNGKDEMTVCISAGGGTSRDMGKSELFKSGTVTHNTIWGGTVVRASDGKVLIPNMSVASGFSSPVVYGDVVYHFSPDMQTATRLIMIDRDTVMAQRLWSRSRRFGYEPNVTRYGDYIYALLASPVNGGQGYEGFDVYHADTGTLSPRRVNVSWGLFPHANSRPYSPVSIVNDLIYFTDSGLGFGGDNRDEAYTCVMEARPQGRIIGQNDMPPRMDAGLAFDADRIYYRNDKGLYCIGYTGDEGRAYEARENARLLLADYPKQTPTAVAAVPVKAFQHYPAKIVPCSTLWELPDEDFYFPITGPKLKDRFASEFTAERILKMVGEDASLEFEGTWRRHLVSRLGDDELHFGRSDGSLERMCLDTTKGYPILSTIGFFEKYTRGDSAWDFKKRGPCTQFYYRVMRETESRTIRFVIKNDKMNDKTRMWLNGVPLEDMARYRIEPGYYGMLIESTIDSDDYWDDNGIRDSYLIDVCFVPAADDADQDIKDHEEDLARIKPYLERVITLAPDSEEAKQARDVLGK